jgi:dephospho-CoA kinase
MLRVGLTGGLGSGKSTAAQMFAAKGAQVFSADEIGRELMQPGQAVYAAILEAIVHPATIVRQAELIEEVAKRDPDAVAMVESALVFETKYGGEGGWQKRFDTVIFVRAPEERRIARFVERMEGSKVLSDEARAALEAEARRRLRNQGETERNAAQCQYVLRNEGSLEELQAQVDAVWVGLKRAAKTSKDL